MKKLFITAVAVLAFSGSGFAKEKVVKSKGVSCMERVTAELNAMEEEDGCWSPSVSSYWNGFAAALCFLR